MNWDDIMANPVTAGMVIAVLGVIGEGLRRMWLAAVRAVVRTLDRVAPISTGNIHRMSDDELVAQVRKEGGSLASVIPNFAIQREVRRRKASDPPLDKPS